MEKLSLLQTFAVDTNGRIQSVHDVNRGLACASRCPTCGEPVLARQGEVREWHFAHSSGTDCAGAAESALHLAAKQLLVESTGMNLPETVVYRTVELLTGQKSEGRASQPIKWQHFASVETEKRIGQIQPDVVASTASTLLFIEIAVTHFVDAEKFQLIQAMGVPAIEIDLSLTPRESWGWDELRQTLIGDVSVKRWLHPLDYGTLMAEAERDAIQKAKAATALTGLSKKTKARRTRFMVQGRIVDVIDYSFAVAIWSPYDPVVNDIIRNMVAPLGGRWQKQFKNWLIPLSARDELIQRIKAVASGPGQIVS